MTLTSRRIQYLYDPTDAAYHAAAIFASEAPGHLAAIDPNFCAQHDLKADWASECARRKFIAMPDPGDL